MDEQGRRRTRITSQDVQSFVSHVEAAFHDKPDQFQEFLTVLQDYKKAMIEFPRSPEVGSVVVPAIIDGGFRVLLRDHPDLILELNKFLPLLLQVQPDLQDAKNFLIKVKNRFRNDVFAYKFLLETMIRFSKGLITANTVKREVSALFINHKDLYREFVFFLPDTLRESSSARDRR